MAFLFIITKVILYTTFWPARGATHHCIKLSSTRLAQLTTLQSVITVSQPEHNELMQNGA